MKIDNLVAHVATGEADNSFVGMKIIGNQIHFYFPESYHFDADNFERDDFLDLLKTIAISKSSSADTAETYDSHKEESELALLSYIWILEDYLKNGFYINSEKILRTNQRGKVNWKSTLQQQPIISGRNIIYSNLMTEVKSPQDTILVEAHRYCVKKSASLIGWIYEVRPEAIEAADNADKMVPRYLAAIKAELDSTFDDEKHFRLEHMENVLLGLGEIAENGNIIYGVDTYNYVFERMIDSIFGTEKAEEYYPTFTWYLKYSAKADGLSGPTIRPDTIMRVGADDDIYIIDSKFYRYGALDFSKSKGLPEAASIVKQITYGSYIQSKYPDNRIYNVFILPYDAQSANAKLIEEDDKNLVYIGEVSSGWESNKTYGHIYTFLIDLRYVVKIWNRMMHDEEKSKLANLVNENIGVLGGNSMADMVAYEQRLIDLAYALIKGKSHEDDMKAAEDLYVLDAILNGMQTHFNLYNIDERLRKKYKTIEMLESIQSEFSYNDGKVMNRIITEEERLMNRLESDRIGVIVDVLIKHEKIKYVDEIYKRISD